MEIIKKWLLKLKMMVVKKNCVMARNKRRMVIVRKRIMVWGRMVKIVTKIII